MNCKHGTTASVRCDLCLAEWWSAIQPYVPFKNEPTPLSKKIGEVAREAALVYFQNRPPSPDEIALLTDLALRDLRDPEPVAYREPTIPGEMEMPAQGLVMRDAVTDPSAYDSFRATLGDECGRLRNENTALLAENATLRRRLETYERKRR